MYLTPNMFEFHNNFIIYLTDSLWRTYFAVGLDYHHEGRPQIMAGRTENLIFSSRQIRIIFSQKKQMR